jgi:hypothetical protein
MNIYGPKDAINLIDGDLIRAKLNRRGIDPAGLIIMKAQLQPKYQPPPMLSSPLELPRWLVAHW